MQASAVLVCCVHERQVLHSGQNLVRKRLGLGLRQFEYVVKRVVLGEASYFEPRSSPEAAPFRVAPPVEDLLWKDQARQVTVIAHRQS